MVKFIFLLFLFVSLSFAVTLDDLIQKVKNNNATLKQMETNIAIAQEELLSEVTWDNPILTLGRNSVHFDDVWALDSEPMQSYFISLSQTIPTNDKLKYRERINKNRIKVAQLDYASMQSKLLSTTYKYAYEAMILQRKIEVLTAYITNTHALQERAIRLYENGKIDQTPSLNADILQSKLTIQQDNIQLKLDAIYLRLQALSNEKISYIEDTLDIPTSKPLALRQTLVEHTVIQSLDHAILKHKEKIKLEQAKKIPDIKAKVSYFSRDDRYVDYANIALSFPLPIYGKENHNIAKARHQRLFIEEKRHDTILKFTTRVETLDRQLKTAYRNYQTIHNTIIPNKQAIKDTIQAHYTQGHAQSLKLLEIDNELFELHLMQLDELSRYYQSIGEQVYFTGIHQ